MQLVPLDVLPFRQLRPPLGQYLLAGSLLQEVQLRRADRLLHVLSRDLVCECLELSALWISLRFWRVIFLQCPIRRPLGDTFELARSINLSLVVQVFEQSLEVLMASTELFELVTEEYLY